MYIICKLTSNGERAKPSRRPFIHADLAAAEAELARLTGLHSGESFGLFQMVRTVVLGRPVQAQKASAAS